MMVLSWLMKSLSPSIAQSVIWIDLARDLWKDLHDQFSQGDAIRISDQSSKCGKDCSSKGQLTECLVDSQGLVQQIILQAMSPQEIVDARQAGR